MAIPDPAGYSADEVLRDGGPILIRAIRPDDKQRLLEHFARLSPRSIYQRFFGFKRSLNDQDLRNFTELDFLDNVGLAATIGVGDDERLIGVGRYMRSGGRDSAEVAFAVLDDYQGRGVGTLLLKHLASVARQTSIKKFIAYVMGSNRQMLEVFANSGFRECDSFESGTVRVTLEIGPSDPATGPRQSERDRERR